MEPTPTIPNFRIEREIGRGGQGAVYLAVDERTGREVALKVLLGVAMLGDEARIRFRREADLSSKLRHPGIREVHEFDLEASPPWIAMRYVEGKILTRALGETDTLPEGPNVASALRILGKVANALHAAHEAGIIHRDVKPGNILVTDAGEPVLLDFGLAHTEEVDLPSLTQTGDLLGTPAYMSPEQLTRKTLRIDQRTDIWSLGVVLFEHLAKRRPFEAPTHQGLYQAILTREPPRLRQLNPRVPAAVEAVVETMLQKDPARRYSSAALLATDLAAAARGGDVMARRIGPVGRLTRWVRREPAWASLLLLLIVALPTIATLVATHRANRPLILAAEAEARFLRQEELISAAYHEATEGSGRAAIPLFEAAIRVNDGSEDAVIGLMYTLFRTGRHDDVLRLAAEYPAMMAHSVMLQGLVADVERRRSPNPNDPAPEASQPIARTPYDLHLTACMLIDAGHDGDRSAFQKALDLARLAVLKCQRPRLAYYDTLAHAAMHVGDKKILHDATAMMTENWPGSALPHYWRALACAREGRYEDAIRHHEAALARDPNATRSLLAIGEIRIGQGNFQAALEAAEAGMTRIGPDANLLDLLGRSLTGLGRGEEALVRVREGLERITNPSSLQKIRVRQRLGFILQRLGRTEEALGEFQAALDVAKDRPTSDLKTDGILSEMAGILLRKGQRVEALALIEQALAQNPNNNYALRMRGTERVRDGKLDLAEADYRAALPNCESDRIRAEVHFHMGSLLSKKKRREAALAEFVEAVRLRPDYATAHTSLANTHRLLGNFEAALDCMRRAHELGSKLPDWKHPTGQWIRDCEAEVAKAQRVRQVASGAEVCASAQDLVELAAFGERCHLPRAALHLYRRAFEADPSLLSTTGLPHRWSAARSAIAAMSETGAPTPGVPIESAVALSSMARNWLMAEVAARATSGSGSTNRDEAWEAFLLDLLQSPDWTNVRDQSRMLSLGGDEMKAWAEFWARLASEREKL